MRRILRPNSWPSQAKTAGQTVGLMPIRQKQQCYQRRYRDDVSADSITKRRGCAAAEQQFLTTNNNNLPANA
jgi:hypothetical protein